MESRERQPTPNDVQRRIKRIQESQNLTDAEMADRLQISPSSWRRTFCGMETRWGRGKDFRDAVDKLRETKKALGVQRWEDILGED
jgi:transcriptional regulator with XRE-family HTH domain